MCEIENLGMQVKAFAEDAMFLAKNAAATGASYAATAMGHAWTNLGTALDAVNTVVCKSPDGVRYLMQGAVSSMEVLTAYDAISLPAKAVKKLQFTQDFISATRWYSSVEYFVNTARVDYFLGKLDKFYSEVCFAVGRVGSAVTFLTKHKWADLAAIASYIGSYSIVQFCVNRVTSLLHFLKIENVLNAVIKVVSSHIIDAAFVAGMVLSMPSRVQSILANEHLIYNVADLVNMVAECALVNLSMATGYNPVVVSVLGIVVATTGIVTMFFDPKNSGGGAGPTLPAGRNVVTPY